MAVLPVSLSARFKGSVMACGVAEQEGIEGLAGAPLVGGGCCLRAQGPGPIGSGLWPSGERRFSAYLCGL